MNNTETINKIITNLSVLTEANKIKWEKYGEKFFYESEEFHIEISSFSMKIDCVFVYNDQVLDFYNYLADRYLQQNVLAQLDNMLVEYINFPD